MAIQGHVALMDPQVAFKGAGQWLDEQVHFYFVPSLLALMLLYAPVLALEISWV